jgi:hypothetical protein
MPAKNVENAGFTAVKLEKCDGRDGGECRSRKLGGSAARDKSSKEDKPGQRGGGYGAGQTGQEATNSPTRKLVRISAGEHYHRDSRKCCEKSARQDPSRGRAGTPRYHLRGQGA